MTKVEQRKTLIGLRDLCKNPQFEVIDKHRYSKGNEYERISEWALKTGNLDTNYFDNLGDRDGYKMAAKPEKLTFKECCTALTFLLRAEHWTEGGFTEALENGTVYKLLSHMVEVM